MEGNASAFFIIREAGDMGKAVLIKALRASFHMFSPAVFEYMRQ